MPWGAKMADENGLPDEPEDAAVPDLSMDFPITCEGIKDLR